MPYSYLFRKQSGRALSFCCILLGMSTAPFEYEERYKTIDPLAIRRALEAAAF